MYFGSKLISKGAYNISGSGDYVNLTAVAADRLGSIGKFYPYGVERPSATQNDKEKFTGYFRDASTGLDYADQRYEQPGSGRFMTPDPYGGSASGTDPGSWNRYAYVGGDPVNNTDPTGLLLYVGPARDSADAPDWWPNVARNYFIQLTPMGRARGRLNEAIEVLLERNNVSEKCQKDLDALSKVSGTTIDLWAIQGALANTDLENGTVSTDPVSALGGPGLEAYGNARQSQADQQYGPGQTIGDIFAHNPGLTASTVLGGSTIFINPDKIGNSLTSNEGLLFHEALHELGMIDEQIQKALGWKDYNDVSDTRRISVRLTQDCIAGKGNQN